ncbi:hypothetical protein FJ365_03880 [Candidatus Dependentiae bacterium]|nr:hypothetical protein [Candidatus Dependentiae bacterium]
MFNHTIKLLLTAGLLCGMVHSSERNDKVEDSARRSTSEKTVVRPLLTRPVVAGMQRPLSDAECAEMFLSLEADLGPLEVRKAQRFLGPILPK